MPLGLPVSAMGPWGRGARASSSLSLPGVQWALRLPQGVSGLVDGQGGPPLAPLSLLRSASSWLVCLQLTRFTGPHPLPADRPSRASLPFGCHTPRVRVVPKAR